MSVFVNKFYNLINLFSGENKYDGSYYHFTCSFESIVCVYCYDKNHRIKERNLILKKYLKKSLNKSENETHN